MAIEVVDSGDLDAAIRDGQPLPRESALYSEKIDTNKDGLITTGEFTAARFAAALDRFDPTLYFGEPRQLRLGMEVTFR